MKITETETYKRLERNLSELIDRPTSVVNNNLIECLQDVLFDLTHDYAISEALEKQTAKKPNYAKSEHYCPDCGCDVGECSQTYNDYCGGCGQKLVWSE